MVPLVRASQFATQKLTSNYGENLQGTVKSKDNPPERMLAELTHLPMDNRGLTKIANLKMCTGVRVIYLYDNKIRRVENLEFAQHCTHLDLQNNELEDLGDLHGLKKLQKLYLDGNRITCVPLS